MSQRAGGRAGWRAGWLAGWLAAGLFALLNEILWSPCAVPAIRSDAVYIRSSSRRLKASARATAHCNAHARLGWQRPAYAAVIYVLCIASLSLMLLSLARALPRRRSAGPATTT